MSINLKNIKEAWYKQPGATVPAPKPGFDTAVKHIDYLLGKIEVLKLENSRLVTENHDIQKNFKLMKRDLKMDIDQVIRKHGFSYGG